MVSYYCGEKGMTIPEQRKRLPLWETLEATKNGIVVLENAEWETLKPLVDAFPWGQTGKHIVEFGDAILEAETVSIEDVGANRETRRRIQKKEKRNGDHNDSL